MVSSIVYEPANLQLRAGVCTAPGRNLLGWLHLVHSLPLAGDTRFCAGLPITLVLQAAVVVMLEQVLLTHPHVVETMCSLESALRSCHGKLERLCAERP